MFEKDITLCGMWMQHGEPAEYCRADAPEADTGVTQVTIALPSGVA
jgi:hypothetical protein